MTCLGEQEIEKYQASRIQGRANLESSTYLSDKLHGQAGAYKPGARLPLLLPPPAHL
jgi:hypothetical protein